MPLFTRVGATVAPTPEARAFFIEVEKYFVSTDRLREAAMIIREHGAGRLRIATINALSGTCLPDAICDFAAAFPDILLSVHTGVSSDIIDLVAKGQVDIGFVALPPGRTDLDFRPLPASEVVCVLPKDHPLAARSAIGPADLHEQDYVALGPGSLMRLELHALLRAADAHPRLRIESLFSGTVVHYVERGLGIAVIDPLAALVVDPERTAVRRFVPRIRLSFPSCMLRVSGAVPCLTDWSPVWSSTIAGSSMRWWTGWHDGRLGRHASEIVRDDHALNPRD